jgi:proteasome accessory factor B
VVGAVRATGRPGAYLPPEGIDLIGHVAHSYGSREEQPLRATVRTRPGHGAGLKRWALRIEPTAEGEVLTLGYRDTDVLARRLVGYGADVVVLDPPEVRDAVVELLRRYAGRYPAPTDVATTHSLAGGVL